MSSPTSAIIIIGTDLVDTYSTSKRFFWLLNVGMILGKLELSNIRIVDQYYSVFSYLKCVLSEEPEEDDDIGKEGFKDKANHCKTPGLQCCHT